MICFANGMKEGTNEIIKGRIIRCNFFRVGCLQASAFGRVSEFDFPYPDVRQRLEELVAAFGADRIMFGSDFPYILEDSPSGPDMAYLETSRLLYEWKLPLTAEELHMIQRGTAEKLFGKWGS